ncbi:MAG: hypothetical protein FJ100_13110 [Deltaproteobacteria bacterium]|nr:hypothetical protein [Deltaproteobacteria bacterium]
MAFKQFHLAPSTGEAVADPRSRSRALIGGDLQMRRAHGTPSKLADPDVLDPVFRAQDFEAVRAWCQRDEDRPLVVEIGFQLGEFAVAYCARRPEIAYLGFEVRKQFCEESARLLRSRGLENARLCLADARLILPDMAAGGRLDELLVFFPDPWWKPRHVKKRLFSDDFVADAHDWLRPGGRLLLKTDVEPYAALAEATLAAHGGYRVERLADPHAGLPWTLRERRCDLHGYPTWAVAGVRQ